MAGTIAIHSPSRRGWTHDGGHFPLPQDLSQNELFSPSSREMFQAWIDSPRDSQDVIAQHVAADQAAPPSLRRAASQEGGTLAEPK